MHYQVVYHMHIVTFDAYLWFKHFACSHFTPFVYIRDTNLFSTSTTGNARINAKCQDDIFSGAPFKVNRPCCRNLSCPVKDRVCKEFREPDSQM